MTNDDMGNSNPADDVPVDDRHFLAHPEVAERLIPILNELAAESDRGAVLIAADIINDHLNTTFERIAPGHLGAKKLRSILEYPGPLGPLSAKADIAVLTGYIGQTSYRTIGLFRKLRNEAAHSQSAFRLEDHKDRVRELTNMGPGTTVMINRTAIQVMIDSMVNNIIEKASELEAEHGIALPKTPREVIDYISHNRHTTKPMEEKLLRMELGVAVWLLLGLMTLERDNKINTAAGGIARPAT